MRLHCAGGDVIEGWAMVDSVDDLENRVERLEELCRQMNTNISSLQTIVTALQNNDYVTRVIPVTQGGKEIGYTITFTKSDPITIYHGEKGETGATGNDGHTPEIGVRQDADGIYYWTLDGEWLTDGGSKIKAQGTDGTNGKSAYELAVEKGYSGTEEEWLESLKGNNGTSGNDGKSAYELAVEKGYRGTLDEWLEDLQGESGQKGESGITPQLKIENGYWHVSYNDGSSWTQLGKATGEDGKPGGDSMFQNIDYKTSSDYVVFTLADGAVITIPTTESRLFDHLQSLIYIPKYADGKATMIRTGIEGTIAGFDFRVSPKEAAAEIAAAWQSVLSMQAVYTLATRAVSHIDMPILSCEADQTEGIISITVSGENLSEAFFDGTQSASVSLCVSDGCNEISSVYIPILFSTSNEIWYTSADNKVVYPTNINFGANILSNTIENGKGVIRFDGPVTEIGDDTFINRDGLTSITIPESVTSIGDYAFGASDGLTSITIPNSVISIGESAFTSCQGLTSISIPESIISIGDRAFNDCQNLMAFYGKYASEDHKLLIKDGVSLAFAPAGMTNYSIPEGVTAIGNGTFEKCSDLTSITIPESVTSIGDLAFDGCHGLTSITIPENVTSIGVQAFRMCIGLKNITIPESVTSIGQSAFSDCHKLKNITIPNSVTSIEAGCFFGTGLTSITIPNSVTSIGEGAFGGCQNLTSITIPESITSIEDGAFQNSAYLMAFYGKYATEDHRALIKDGEFLAFAPAGMTDYSIPEGVTAIGGYAFLGCGLLTSITIPESVTSIGESAFSSCLGLKNITIPENVTSIGENAFGGCFQLTSAYCKRNTPPSIITNVFGVFGGAHADFQIYVPTTSVEAYKSAPGWSDYADRIVGYDFN
ncbi:leucine-rich repeat protein [Alistipes ihumii]|uniref:leucine-rich repeat protein n=1 Tax=Alistipes ihumii TaxID=1470347 RepID=UPI0026584550|nr:leucine-rich repeat protein [Alistipes ihumii]